MRWHEQFPAIALLLASRGIDAAKTVVLDGDFAPGGGYLLVLPCGVWVEIDVEIDLAGNHVLEWCEIGPTDFSEDFQEQIAKYRKDHYVA
jgi:hypothetical protein